MKIMTVRQYAKKIGKSESWVKKLIYAGKLDATKLNPKMWLIKIHETSQNGG